MRNKYPGPCYRCGDLVGVGEGHFERRNGRWRTQHAECARQWKGRTTPTTEEAKAARVRVKEESARAKAANSFRKAG